MRPQFTAPHLESVTIDEIRRAYSPGPGAHWFDPETLRWFRCRLPQYGYRGPGGTFFVSSEKGPRYTSPRLYTVRQLVGPGEIEDVGGFQRYASRSGADKAAKRAAEGRGL